MGWKPDHKRMREKRVRPPNAAEERHISRLVEMGCLICGMDAEYHHIHSDGFQRLLRDHRYGAPLCPGHHRGNAGIHSLGHHAFTEQYGIDLWAWAQAEWLASERRAA